MIIRLGGLSRRLGGRATHTSVLSKGHGGASAGGGVPPWVASKTAGEWALLTSNSISSLYPYLDGSVNPNGAGNAPPWQPGGTSPTATLWASMWTVQNHPKVMLGAVGGHGGYSGNEWYIADLSVASPLWSRALDPTGSTGRPGTTTHDASGQYSDGQIGCFHHYGVGAVSADGLIIPIMPAATNGSGANIAHAHRINTTTGLSTALGSSASFCGASNPGFSCYDSSRNRVWHCHHGSSQLFTINPSNGEMAGFGPTEDYWTGEGVAVYIPGVYPAGDCMAVVSGGRELTIIALDGTGSYAKVQPSLSGSYASGYSLNETGAAWDNARKVMYLWNNSSNTKQISTLAPVSSANLAGAWTRGTLAAPSGGATPGASASGTYGRFAYLESADCLVLQNEFTDQLLVYRLG